MTISRMLHPRSEEINVHIASIIHAALCIIHLQQDSGCKSYNVRHILREVLDNNMHLLQCNVAFSKQSYLDTQKNTTQGVHNNCQRHVVLERDYTQLNIQGS